jgi:hypothetical protein
MYGLAREKMLKSSQDSRWNGDITNYEAERAATTPH